MSTKNYYTSTELLTAAFRFREAELWNKLYDYHIFGVTLKSGEIGYCLIMGSEGTYCGMGFYRGANGYASMLQMSKSAKDDIELLMRTLTLDVINCHFTQASELTGKQKDPVRAFSKEFGLPIPRKNGWPEFVRYQPFRELHPMDNETDGEDLALALRAGRFIADELKTKSLEEIGFSDEYPTEEGGKVIPLVVHDGSLNFHLEKTTLPVPQDYEYPCPTYDDEEVAELLRKRKGEGTFEIGAVYIPVNIAVNTDNMAHFFIPILSKETDFFSIVMTRAPYDVKPQTLLDDFISTITSEGKSKPASIICTDELTHCLLADFCRKAGIMLATAEKSEDFAEATLNLLYSMRSGF